MSIPRIVKCRKRPKAITEFSFQLQNEIRPHSVNSDRPVFPCVKIGSHVDVTLRIRLKSKALKDVLDIIAKNADFGSQEFNALRMHIDGPTKKKGKKR